MESGFGFATWVAGCILEGVSFLPIDPCWNQNCRSQIADESKKQRVPDLVRELPIEWVVADASSYSPQYLSTSFILVDEEGRCVFESGSNSPLPSVSSTNAPLLENSLFAMYTRSSSFIQPNERLHVPFRSHLSIPQSTRHSQSLDVLFHRRLLHPLYCLLHADQLHRLRHRPPRQFHQPHDPASPLASHIFTLQSSFSRVRRSASRNALASPRRLRHATLH